MDKIPFLKDIPELSLQTEIYGNTILKYLIALAILVVMLAATSLIRKCINVLVKKIAKRITNVSAARILRGEEKLTPILQYLPFYIVVNYLKVPAWLLGLVGKLGVVIIAICVTRYLIEVVKTLSKHMVTSKGSNPLIMHSINMFASLLLYAAALLFILSNLGFNINTLLAGVGIGGMAIALASQTLLADIFNYFTILLDKPFTIGDFVTVNGYTGTVERIGIKGTRLRASSGEQFIISNTDMTKSALTTTATMVKRRMLTVLGVTYGTKRETVAEIPGVLKTIVESVKETEFSRAHFKEFADNSLNIELVYFVTSADYTVYMDRVQEINLKIMDEFEKRGVGFAFPSRSLYIETPWWEHPRNKEQEG